jgi:hypothetical protein
MGLLDGDFSGFVGDDKVKDEFGQTQADRRAPLWSGLINAGLLAVAGGGNLMPAERAKYIAQAGGALGGIGTDMIQARSAAAQQALRAQEIKGKAVDLAQSQKWRDYASSPEFQAALDQAKATPAEIMEAKAAAMKGDFATVTKVLDPKRNQADIKGNLVRLPDGSIANTLGRVIFDKDGKPVSGAASDGFDLTKPNVGGTDRLDLTALQGQPHEIAVQALRVARGEQAPPSSRSSPDAPLINQLAAQVAGANGTSFNARQNFEKSIISGGTTNKMVIAPWAASMQHAQEAIEAYDAIGNAEGGKGQQYLNMARNKLTSVTDPNVVRNMARFEQGIRVYAQEMQKLIAGGGQVTDEARREVEKLQDPNQTPAAVIGAMQALTQMGHVRLAQVVQDARSVRHDSAIDINGIGLAPEALKAHEWITNRLANGPGTANPGGGAGAPAAPAGGGPALAEGEKNLGPLPGGKFKIQKADGSIVVR